MCLIYRKKPQRRLKTSLTFSHININLLQHCFVFRFRNNIIFNESVTLIILGQSCKKGSNRPQTTSNIRLQKHRRSLYNSHSRYHDLRHRLLSWHEYLLSSVYWPDQFSCPSQTVTRNCEQFISIRSLKMTYFDDKKGILRH